MGFTEGHENALRVGEGNGYPSFVSFFSLSENFSFSRVFFHSGISIFLYAFVFNAFVVVSLPPPHVSPSSPSQAVPSKQCIGCGQGDGGAGNRRTRARVTPGPEGIFTPSLRAREIEAAVDITRLWFALYSYPAAMGVQGLIGLIGG